MSNPCCYGDIYCIEHRPVSNQATLNNSCVCDSGCEACDRLAEAFAAMMQSLTEIVGLHNHSLIADGSLDRAAAALAQAEKVKP